MRHRILSDAACAIAALLCAACNNTGCTDNQNSVPLAGFYSYTTGQAVTIDSLAIWGEGSPGDSLLVRPTAKAGNTYLPFRAAHSSATFVISYRQKALGGLSDRVTFYYDSQPWFASEECGAMYRYRITRVVHTSVLLDSVGVADSLVTNVETQQIGLYFRTAPPAGADPDREGRPHV